MKTKARKGKSIDPLTLAQELEAEYPPLEIYPVQMNDEWVVASMNPINR
jgi:hypothetical protein